MNAASRYSLIAIVGICLAADVRLVVDRSPPATQLIVSVGDAGTGAFVADAQVRLPSVGRVARTQWNGEAWFSALSAGKYRIQVRAIGYAPSDIDMTPFEPTIWPALRYTIV